MNETVDDLVLAPFRDIVAHGEVAINNAGDSGDVEMLRAAQALVKEGERAMKKLEPVCRKHHEEYGPNFVDALIDNGMRRLPPFRSNAMLTIQQSQYASLRRSLMVFSTTSRIMWKPTSSTLADFQSCMRCPGRQHHGYFISLLA